MANNREWHGLTSCRNATLDERLTWHIRHAAHCGCREMPRAIKRELAARGLDVPTPRSLT